LGLIDPLFEKSPNNLIAQSYDGAAIIGQKAGVKRKEPILLFDSLLCSPIEFHNDAINFKK